MNSVLISLFLLGMSTSASPVADDVRIGLIETLFGEKNPKSIEVEVEEFKKLINAATKLSGSSSKVPDAKGLADQMVSKKLDLGVCHGFELAWLKSQHPQVKFQPLVIAITEQPRVNSLLIVKADGPIQKFADLKGKSLAFSKNSKAYTRLFVDTLCRQAGGSFDTYFSKMTKEFTGKDKKTRDMNSEIALDQVVDGKADATPVDAIAFKQYTRLKPERAKLLKAIETSVEFPASAVFSIQGNVDPAKLAKYREALLNFHKSSKEAEGLLENWRLSQFTEVPADYEQQLETILKAYPPAK